MDDVLRDPYWKKYLQFYVTDRASWYVAKASVGDPARVTALLTALRRFVGRPWKEAQHAYIAELRRRGIVDPYVKEKRSQADRAAPGRMAKMALGTPGLAWVDASSAVYITDVGKAYLRAGSDKARSAVIERQLWKFQFWNPAMGARSAITLFPHAFLVRLLLTFGDGVSQEEYDLFVSRVRSEDEFEAICERIKKWRDLAPKQRKRVLEHVKQFAVPGKAIKPTSMLDRIQSGRAYVWAFHAAGENVVIVAEREGGRRRLELAPGRRPQAQARLREHDHNAIFVDFADDREYFAYYGELRDSSPLTARAIYEKRNDIAAAAEMFRVARRKGLRTGERGNETAYIEARAREKILEDFLEYHLDQLEHGLVLHRGKGRKGRQYPTEVGPIDLLARAPDGSWVVIELKRDRAADKVFGQTSRYIGWVRNNLAARGEQVRGIIVAHDIDRNLRNAAAADPSRIGLYRFHGGFWFESVQAAAGRRRGASHQRNRRV
jgi:hypothetical protein